MTSHAPILKSVNQYGKIVLKKTKINKIQMVIRRINIKRQKNKTGLKKWNRLHFRKKIKNLWILSISAKNLFHHKLNHKTKTSFSLFVMTIKMIVGKITIKRRKRKRRNMKGICQTMINRLIFSH